MEFEIVGGATDATIAPDDPSNFLPATTSTSWQIEDVRIVGDVVTLDSALQNSYAEHVLDGNHHKLTIRPIFHYYKLAQVLISE